ncbi:MAG: hypothetical protein ACREQI_00140 [Candidatus Binataceae bacterium]
MGVLKRKEESVESITLRVPASVKAEVDRLREKATAAGFDLNGTLCDSIVRLVKQIRGEMDALDRKSASTDTSRKPTRPNGIAHQDRTSAASSADGRAEG